jgi:DNA primase
MAKVSPVSIKYMVHANFTAEGALEKPDVIGAIFGQTEGLLGADLEMRELQKEGKIGRIEVSLERKDKLTTGIIQIPTAVDQPETTLIAAAIETIERMGPCDCQIEIEKIEDVRGNKRDYILERAKKLMQEIHGSTDSRAISNEIKDATKTSEITEYGTEKLPAGDLSGKEVIVVEGRADVINMLKAGVKNVIGMNGTKLPEAIKKLGEEKDLILFVDGDRGGKLIARNVVDNAKVKSIAVAPDGKEVEELTGKEILMNLRKAVSPSFFFKRVGSEVVAEKPSESAPKKSEKLELDEEKRAEIKKIYNKNEGSGKAILLNASLGKFKEVSGKSLSGTLKRIRDKPAVIVLDGTVTGSVLQSAEEAGCQVIAASNFAATDTKIELLSF